MTARGPPRPASALYPPSCGSSESLAAGWWTRLSHLTLTQTLTLRLALALTLLLTLTLTLTLSLTLTLTLTLTPTLTCADDADPPSVPEALRPQVW